MHWFYLHMKIYCCSWRFNLFRCAKKSTKQEKRIWNLDSHNQKTLCSSQLRIFVPSLSVRTTCLFWKVNALPPGKAKFHIQSSYQNTIVSGDECNLFDDFSRCKDRSGTTHSKSTVRTQPRKLLPIFLQIMSYYCHYSCTLCCRFQFIRK